MDTFITLSNRLLTRCPAVGIALAQQLIQDNWHTLQSRREWSWRRRSGVFAPPNLYQFGTVSTNVWNGQPTLIIGTDTSWDGTFVGRQIRIGGLLNLYYTIVAVIDANHLLIDSPWVGGAADIGWGGGGWGGGGWGGVTLDVTNAPYQILQLYYPVPADFGYFYVAVSVKDGYRLWTSATEADLAILDPQRTNTGQTYAVVFKDYTPQYAGMIGPVVPVGATGAAPVSTTTTGFSYVANSTYIVQVVAGGLSGTATYKWMRAGQTAFSPVLVTSDQPIDLMDGVQIYWPDSAFYIANDLFIINAQAQISVGAPRYELWPSPTYAGYLYPYIYIAKEYDLTVQQPQLPPFVANRGEVLLKMALSECASYPGPDADHPNPYFNLALAKMHKTEAEMLLNDLERNDEEVGVTNISYQEWSFGGPWADGNYRQQHAPFLVGSGW